MKLFFSACFLALFSALLLFPVSAVAADKMCQINTKPLSKELRQEAKKIASLSAPVARYDRGQAESEAPVIDQALVRKMLRASWASFAYRGKSLQRRVNLNMLQIKADSSYKPHLEGLFLGQVATPELGNPGGLFAFFDDHYQEWRSYPGWKGSASRFNPLSNIFAAVSAQVHSQKIFSGQGRISVPQNNPCS